MPDQYAIYLRKSRSDAEAEAHGEGETLSRHRAALFELASKRGLQISDVFQEIVSGDTIADRPQMQKLLAGVYERKYKGVLVMEVERLARGDTIDQGTVSLAFRATNTMIVTPYRTYDPSNDMDEDYFEFNLFMARREYKAITRRMQAGRIASVKEGKYAGAMEVYGYRRIKLQNQKGWSLEIVPEQAKIVRLIFSWYAYGMDGKTVGMNAIANRLNNMGILSPRGGSWTRASIRNLLRNDILRGYVSWNKRVKNRAYAAGSESSQKRPLSGNPILVNGMHEAIIDHETWTSVQTILNNNPPAPASSGIPLSNPFAGILYCALCGHAMIRRPDFGSRSQGIPGVCCKTKGCPTTGIALPIVEHAVLEVLSSWDREYELEATSNFYSSLTEETTKALRESIASLDAQLSKIHSLLERGIYSEETFVMRRSELSARIESAKAELDAHYKSSKCRAQSMQAILPRVHGILDLYKLAETAEEKNRLLKSIISRINYHKTKHCYRNENPSTYLSLDIIPIIQHPDPDIPRTNDTMR